MPWNNGGPGPWGNPSGSPAETATRSRPKGRGATGRQQRRGRGRTADRGAPSRDGKPRRPRPGGPFGGGGGPFGGGGGPFGGGNAPDLDRLIAQAQGYIRGLMGGGSGGRSGRRPVRRLRQRPRPDLPAAAGGRGLGRQRLLPRAAGRAGRGAALRRLFLLDPARPALAPALAGRDRGTAHRHPHQPHRDRLSLRARRQRRSRPGHRRPRRAGRKPDADRRREHHRHRRRRVLAHQRRRRRSCSTPPTRKPWCAAWPKARCAR